VRLLLDNCVWSKAADELREAGHDVDWVGNWGADPGDDEILARAHAESRVLVTLDKDFGELAIVRGMKHSGIVRLVDLSAQQQAEHCLLAIARHGADLEKGAIVTVKKTRIRFRPPPEP
jgi:predicted nuclease of predicted toxin-antitoxin system